VLVTPIIESKSGYPWPWYGGLDLRLTEQVRLRRGSASSAGVWVGARPGSLADKLLEVPPDAPSR